MNWDTVNQSEWYIRLYQLWMALHTAMIRNPWMIGVCALILISDFLVSNTWPEFYERRVRGVAWTLIWLSAIVALLATAGPWLYQLVTTHPAAR
jgi:hypothetical protein